MTYLNSPSQTQAASAPLPLHANPADMTAHNLAAHNPALREPGAGPSAALRLLMALALWLVGMKARCRTQAQSDRMFRSKRIQAALWAFSLGIRLLPGTRAEKARIMDIMFGTAKAKTLGKYKRLFRAYLIWRQRKCWAWGGGFMSGALAVLACRFKGASDAYSFDTLIPD